MNVHDKAHELARAIQQSDVYKQFKQAKQQLEENKSALEMVKDFRSKQLEVQQAQLLGLEIPEEKNKSLENLFALINHNPLVAEYFRAEFTFVQIVADIQKILQQAIEDDL